MCYSIKSMFESALKCRRFRWHHGENHGRFHEKIVIVPICPNNFFDVAPCKKFFFYNRNFKIFSAISPSDIIKKTSSFSAGENLKISSADDILKNSNLLFVCLQ